MPSKRSDLDAIMGEFHKRVADLGGYLSCEVDQNATFPALNCELQMESAGLSSNYSQHSVYSDLTAFQVELYPNTVQATVKGTIDVTPGIREQEMRGIYGSTLVETTPNRTKLRFRKAVSVPLYENQTPEAVAEELFYETMRAAGQSVNELYQKLN